MLENALDAQLAAVDAGAGHTSCGNGRSVGVDADLERAIGRAVAACYVALLDDVLVGDLDWIPLAASEQHDFRPQPLLGVQGIGMISIKTLA